MMTKDGVLKSLNCKQKSLAEILVNPEFDGTVSDACTQVGISRNTFYRWLRDPNFKGALEAAIDDYTDSELAHIWRSLITKAKSGSIEAMKLYLELKGKYKQKVSLDGGVVIISGEDEIPE